MLGHAVTHAPINVQNMAVQAIGGTVSEEAGGQLANKMKVNAAATATPVHDGARARHGAGGAGASGDNHRSKGLHSRPLDAHEKRTMAEASDVAQRQLNDPLLSWSSTNKDDPIYKLSEINRAQMSRHPSSTAKISQVGFFGGMKNKLKEAYSTAAEWSLAGMEQVGKVSKQISHAYSGYGVKAEIEAGHAMNKPVLDSMAAEAGGDVGMSRARIDQSHSRLYNQGAKALNGLSTFARRGVIGVDVASKINEVRNAEGRRLRTAFEKTAEFAGEVIGAEIGVGLVASTIVPSMGTSLLVAPPVMIGAAVTGGYLAEQGTMWAENEFDSITSGRGW